MAEDRLGRDGFSRDGEKSRVFNYSKPVPGGVTDHGSLFNLSGDHHLQYLHLSAARTVTAQHTFNPPIAGAPFLLGANAQGQTVVGLRADQLNKSVSTSSGILGGGALIGDLSLILDWGSPTITTIQPDDTASAGSSTNPARSDHRHAITADAPGSISPDDSANEGTAASFARSDHRHANVTAAPGANSVNLAASAEGLATSFARSDHSHQLDQSISPTWTGQHIFQGNVITRHIRPELTDTYDLGTEVYWYRQQFVSQINATVFAESTAQLLGGWFIIPKDAGKLGAVGSATTQVDFGKAMTSGHFVLIKAHDASGTIKTEYMQVGSLVSGTTYNVTRDVAGAHTSDPVWSDGTPWMLLGTSGDGRIELNAYDTPRIQMVAQGAAYNAQSELLRIGDLNGNWGYTGQTFGMAIGERATGKVNLTMDATNGFRVFLNATQLGQWDTGGNITVGQVAMNIGNVYLSSTGYLALRSGTNGTVERLRLNADGSGYLANANVTWNTSGVMTISGWTIDSASIRNSASTFQLQSGGYLKAGTGIDGASFSGIDINASGIFGWYNGSRTFSVWSSSALIEIYPLKIQNNVIDVGSGSLRVGVTSPSNTYLSTYGVTVSGTFRTDYYAAGVLTAYLEYASGFNFWTSANSAVTFSVGGSGATVYGSSLNFYNGYGGSATWVGQISASDTTWLRINQDVAKNIYTPRMFRADGGLAAGNTSPNAGEVRATSHIYTDGVIAKSTTLSTCVYRSTAQTIATGSWVAISFDTLLWDDYGPHSSPWSSGTPTRLTIRVAGTYTISAHVDFASNATGERVAVIRINGVLVALNGGSGTGQSKSVSTMWKCSVGDYIEFVVLQTSGGNLNTTASAYYSARLAIARIA
jgi:hypothetical protein